jgi:HEAT repeats
MSVQRLSDGQVRSFLANGIVTVQPNLPESFHRAIYDAFDKIVPDDHIELPGKKKLHNPGNNILPLIPQLGELLEDPAVKGALTSLVGPEYFIEPHRALHNNMPADGEQHLHKDSYCGFKRHVRTQRPWTVIVFYYPQSTPPERGPTGVVRGSQYALKHPGVTTGEAHPLGGAAGCCAIAAADIWHARMRNRTNSKRFMLKFLATRLTAPSSPSWDCADDAWRDPDDAPDSYPLRPVWRSTWNWMAGKAPAHANGSAPDESGLYDEDENRALATAYQLGGRGAAGVAALAKALATAQGESLFDDRAITSDSGYQYQEAPAARAAIYGLAAAGEEAIPALVAAAGSDSALLRKFATFALGEVGARNGAVEQALTRATRDPDPQVRLNAQCSLGRSAIAVNAIESVRAGLADADDEVRIQAAIALARGAAQGLQAPEIAAAALKDANRYVVGHAVEALDRMGTKEALRHLVPFLKTARWCPFTRSGESIY